MKTKLIAIIGRSASGKDTLLKRFLSFHKDLHPIIHYTTRPIRPGETEGKEYHFVSVEEFTRMRDNQEFFHVAQFNNWWYGIHQDSFSSEAINIGIFNPDEIQRLYNFYQDEFDLYIIETWTSANTLYKRSLERLKDTCFDEEGLKEMCRRYKADTEDFQKIASIPRYRLETTSVLDHCTSDGFVEGLMYALGQN